MKVLVTGANGYLGQGIIKNILDSGHDVTAVDVTTQYIDDRAKKISCDLFKGNKLYEYFNETETLLDGANQ